MANTCVTFTNVDGNTVRSPKLQQTPKLSTLPARTGGADIRRDHLRVQAVRRRGPFALWSQPRHRRLRQRLVELHAHPSKLSRDCGALPLLSFKLLFWLLNDQASRMATPWVPSLAVAASWTLRKTRSSRPRTGPTAWAPWCAIGSDVGCDADIAIWQRQL